VPGSEKNRCTACFESASQVGTFKNSPGRGWGLKLINKSKSIDFDYEIQEKKGTRLVRRQNPKTGAHVRGSSELYFCLENEQKPYTNQRLAGLSGKNIKFTIELHPRQAGL
jgi:hypothetical protein